VPAKALLVFGLGLNAGCTLVFGLLPVQLSMYSCKVLMGVTQALQGVFGVCWVLLWAPEGVKTLWMGFGAAAAGLGNGLGMAIAGFGTAQGLPYSFAYVFEFSVLAGLWALLLAAPGWRLGISADPPDRNAAGGSMELQTPAEASADSGAVAQGAAAVQVGDTRAVDAGPGEPSGPPLRPPTGQLSALARDGLYVWTGLSLASIFFVLSGVQFLWVQVFDEAFGIDKNVAVSAFLAATGVGGLFGVAVGPVVVDRAGGLDAPAGRASSLRAIAAMLCLGVLGSGLSLSGLLWRAVRLSGPAPVGSIALAWGGCLLVFACLNSAVAGLTGLNVTAVDPSLRSLASGCTICVQNLVGYAMGPLLSGAAMDLIMDLAGVLGLDKSSAKRGDQRALLFGLGFVLIGALAAALCSSRALVAARRASARPVAGREGGAASLSQGQQSSQQEE